MSLSSLTALTPFIQPTVSFPPTADEIAQATKIALAHRNLHEAPHEIGRLSSLRKLWLHHNKILFLPDSFSMLTGMIELRLDFNLLSDVPPCIQSMTGLQALDLRGNKIPYLPVWMTNLRTLETFHIIRQSGFEIQLVPESISSLPCWNNNDELQRAQLCHPDMISSIMQKDEIIREQDRQIRALQSELINQQAKCDSLNAHIAKLGIKDGDPSYPSSVRIFDSDPSLPIQDNQPTSRGLRPLALDALQSFEQSRIRHFLSKDQPIRLKSSPKKIDGDAKTLLAFQSGVLCWLCCNVYDNPRKLSCGHVFCDVCLTNAIANARLGPPYMCPSCPEVHPLQDLEKEAPLSPFHDELVKKTCGNE